MHPSIVFDLDGTLIDSAPDLADSLNQVLAEHGHPPLGLEEVKHMIGEGVPILMSRAFAAVGVTVSEDELEAETRRYRAIYESRAAERTVAYPGAVAVLEELRAAGVSLGLCTNKPQRAALKVLEALGLAPFFDGVIGGDLARHRKPDGRHLLDVLAAMAAEPEHAVYIGDSETDLAAARDAGIPVILVDFGYSRTPVARLRPDGVISDFTELLSVLESLGREAQGA